MRYLLVLLLAGLFLSCEKDIDFDLKESAPTLVVEGEIENGRHGVGERSLSG